MEPIQILTEHLEPLAGTAVVGLMGGAIVGNETSSIACGAQHPGSASRRLSRNPFSLLRARSRESSRARLTN